MYKCRHFEIRELVPRHVYEERGEKAWMLLDERALVMLDLLRDKYGSITINDWAWGGTNQWRGLRTEVSPVGSQYSQHRFGRAFDLKFKDISAEEVRIHILGNKKDWPYVHSLELGTSWLHFDVRNCEPIMTYKP